MLMLLELPRLSLESLPRILLGVLIIVLFVVILWHLLSKLPERFQGWVKWALIGLGGILLLWFLISLV